MILFNSLLSGRSSELLTSFRNNLVARRLKQFPFDELGFIVAECMASEQGLESTEEIELIFGTGDNTDPLTGTGTSLYSKGLVWNGGFESGEHIVTRVGWGVTHHRSQSESITYNDFYFSIDLARRRDFYKNKVFAPLWVLTGLGEASFFFPPENLEARLNNITALYLTLFAIQWTVSDRMPRTPYTTVVDLSIMAVTINFFVIALGCCIAYRVAIDDGSNDEPSTGGLYTNAGVVDAVFFAAGLLIFVGLHVWLAFCRIDPKANGRVKLSKSKGWHKSMFPGRRGCFAYMVKEDEEGSFSMTHVKVDDP